MVYILKVPFSSSVWRFSLFIYFPKFNKVQNNASSMILFHTCSQMCYIINTSEDTKVMYFDTSAFRKIETHSRRKPPIRKKLRPREL